jgi:hypothetical protein
MNTNQKHSGGLASLFRGIRHLILNKSDEESFLKNTGGWEEYWDRMIAAQYGWPGRQRQSEQAPTAGSKA